MDYGKENVFVITDEISLIRHTQRQTQTNTDTYTHHGTTYSSLVSLLKNLNS